MKLINRLKVKPTFKILIYNLSNEKNLGDKIINECVEYLLHKITHNIQDCLIDIKSFDMKEENKYNYAAYANLIIFAGGGIIKYKYQRFPYYIHRIVTTAYKNQIPVIFNAVGVEGYDNDDVRCQRLKMWLNFENVKCISTRDNITLLKSKYIFNKRIETQLVADPAFWTKETYNISRKESDLIGIGIVRAKIFEVNGIHYSQENYISLMVELLKELTRRNFKWKMFTNGLPEDNDTLIEIANRLGYEDYLTVSYPRAETDLELIEQISTFEKIISCRLHSHIISYALHIPSIGLVWNEKLSMFGNIIGRSKNFLESKDFDVQIIMDRLLCLNEYDKNEIDFYNHYKYTVLESLSQNILHYIEEYVKYTKKILLFKNVYLFGAGKELSDKRINKDVFSKISGIVDYREKYIGTSFDKFVIQNYLNVKGKKNILFIITRNVFYLEAKLMLEKLGFKEGKHFIKCFEYDNFKYKDFELYNELTWNNQY